MVVVTKKEEWTGAKEKEGGDDGRKRAKESCSNYVNLPHTLILYFILQARGGPFKLLEVLAVVSFPLNCKSAGILWSYGEIQIKDNKVDDPDLGDQPAKHNLIVWNFHWECESQSQRLEIMWLVFLV